MVSNGGLSRVITADVSRAIGLDELPDDQREEFVAAVDAEFHRRFADTIRKNADPAAVAELDALSEADVETLLRWVERHRPGIAMIRSTTRWSARPPRAKTRSPSRSTTP